MLQRASGRFRGEQVQSLIPLWLTARAMHPTLNVSSPGRPPTLASTQDQLVVRYEVIDAALIRASRKLFSTTLTLLNAIAALAIIGESSHPVNG